MKVENRNIKYPRIEFRTGEPHFIMPYGMDYKPILDKYEDWITEKDAEISKALKYSNKLKLYKRNQVEVKKEVNKIVDKYSPEYGLVVNRIIFKKLISKWGSCSSLGNLTFNKKLSFLPDKHFSYVIFHELMHLIERKHTPAYWSLVTEKFPEYKRIERELFSYWFLINSTQKLKGSHK